MPIPENAEAIYKALTGAGFNANAAAGILGNIEQESGGNPQEQGGGLIQILGQAGGTLTEQIAATLTYIKQNGSISDINAHASSPSAAALYFSTAYERPNAQLANNANRESSATEVAAAATSGKWPAGTAANPSGTGGGSLGDIVGDASSFLKDMDDFVTIAHDLTQPSFWLRIGAFAAGMVFLAMGMWSLIKALDPDMKAPTPMPIPVPI